MPETYTLKKDADRGAQRMIAKGAAPSDQYTVEPAGERYAIYWKVSRSPEELEHEGEYLQMPPDFDEPQLFDTSGVTPLKEEPLASPEPEPSTKHAKERRNGAIHPAAAVPRGSKDTAPDEAAARGEMPALPNLDKPSAAGYKARAEKLQALALAGDWTNVETFPLPANNTYTKVLKKYRERLITAHHAQMTNALA